MATQSKQDAIVQMALEFYIDEGSLVNALNKAQARYKALNASSRAASTAEDVKMYNKLVKSSETTEIKIARQRKQINDKTRKEELAAEAKLLRDKEALNKKYQSQQASAEKASSGKDGSFTGGFSNFSSKLGTISAYGSAITIINSVTRAISFAISKTIEYEKAFTDLAVKSGYTKSEMKEVTVSIFDTANATKYSTLEIVEASTALGKLGFEASEVVEILPNLAAVAGATGESLEKTAEVFGKILNAYELTAEHSQSISDRMVQIFNNSALDLEKFNTAFSYVGSAAASTGTSFDQLTAAMSVLSDRGITASKIGTGLRNVFVKLGRSGDTLRDILQRVSDEQMSFYELAELVGNRAANQLHVLVDSLEEYDKSVADSSKKYGLAMEANALQMSTFSAKWDIFLNNITNKVTGSDADPLSDFRYNLRTTLNMMDTFNSFNLLNSKGSEATVDSFLNANQELFKKIRDLRTQNKDLTKDEIYKIVTKEHTETIDGLVTGLFTSLTDKEKALVESAKKERAEIRKIFNFDDGDDIFTVVDRYINGEKKSRFVDLQEKYANNMQTLGDFIKGNMQSKPAAELKKAIDDNNQKLAHEIFAREFGSAAGTGALDKNTYQRFKKEMQYALDFRVHETEKSLGNWIDESNSRTAFDGLKADLATIDSAIERMKAKAKDNADKKIETSYSDIKQLDTANDARLQFIEKWCGLAKDQPYLYEWLESLGITCKTASSGVKKKGDIGKIDKFTELREDYKTNKDLLNKQYDAENDPIKKLQINDKLISLEESFRKKLNGLYKDYLAKQAAERNSFIKKYPEQTKEYDDNIKTTEDSQIKDAGEGNRFINTYSTRDIDVKAEAYKQDILNQNTYKEKVSAIDLELRSLDRKDTKARAILLAERNKISKDYYIDAEKNLSLHFAKLKGELEKIEKANKEAMLNLSVSENGSVITPAQIDTSDLLEKISLYEAEIKKLRDEANKAQKTGNGNDREDFDYFPLVMEMSDNLYNVYAELGNRKLELLKEQTERELEVISERFEREATIRNSALNAGIISQEQATEAEERARKSKIDKENVVNKKLFDAQKKRDKEDAIFTGLTSTANAIANIFSKNAGNPIAVGILTSISAAAIASSTAMNIGAISKRKFVPQQYADGGLVEGKSHAEGGVPFTVKGRGGYEMEGGEFIVNKESTKKHFNELQRINSKKQVSNFKFATGGVVTNASNSNESFNEALLEALNRPVRAFVTSQDLTKSNSEREALTKKTSY